MYNLQLNDVIVLSGVKMNIYDFDKTIYDGDSSIDFLKYAIKQNKKCLLIFPKLFFSLCLYLTKIKEKEYFKSILFSFIKYFDNIDDLIQNFWITHKDKIKNFYLNQKKDTDIIISASPELLLKPISKELNFKLIGTIINKKTGKVIGKNCYGIEKVKRLKELNIVSCNNFYSDSLSDTPLKEIAASSYIVNGNTLIKWEEYKETRTKKLIKTFLNRDFITFATIGLINVFNGVWISLFYNLFITNSILAYILGFFTSLIIAFILNTKWNFKESITLKKFIKYAINNIPNFIIQISSVLIFIKLLKVNKLISYIISASISVPITFLLVKINVYKNK